MGNERIDAVNADGYGLRVEFSWHHDRYSHTVSLLDAAGAVIPLLESIEGASDDDWPPSPPLQTLSIEKLPDGRTAALLVGMAGRSHWSASIEPIGGRTAIAIDVACRFTPPPEFARPPRRLGTSYFPVSPLASLRLAIVGEMAAVLDASGVIEITPTNIAQAGTTRWRYVLNAQY